MIHFEQTTMLIEQKDEDGKKNNYAGKVTGRHSVWQSDA
jgi:hypothetical protein